jgi:spoIIIJ-associated protein
MTEFSGRTVNEAIETGLQDLGLTPDDVDVEILEEGRGGVFGMGARLARVRLTPRGQDTGITPIAEQPEAKAAPANDQPQPTPAPDEAAEAAGVADPPLETARDFLQGLLDHMELPATVEASKEPPADGEDEETYYLNIAGDDLSLLIGRRGETLDAIQYLVRLVVNQRTHKWPHIEIDVEHYKKRRLRGLQRLAEQMAAQAVSEHRTMVLEAMAPRDRRIIHMTLRDRTDVTTRSIGEGDNRKVTIIPT